MIFLCKLTAVVETLLWVFWPFFISVFHQEWMKNPAWASDALLPAEASFFTLKFSHATLECNSQATFFSAHGTCPATVLGLVAAPPGGKQEGRLPRTPSPWRVRNCWNCWEWYQFHPWPGGPSRAIRPFWAMEKAFRKSKNGNWGAGKGRCLGPKTSSLFLLCKMGLWHSWRWETTFCHWLSGYHFLAVSPAFRGSG